MAEPLSTGALLGVRGKPKHPNRGMGSPSEPPKAGSQPSAELEVPRSGTRRARGEPDRGVEWVSSLVIRRYKQLAPFDRGEGAW